MPSQSACTAFQTRPRPVAAIRWEPDVIHPAEVYEFIGAHGGTSDYMSGVTDGRFYLCAGPSGGYRRIGVVYPGCWVVSHFYGSLKVVRAEDFDQDYERV